VAPQARLWCDRAGAGLEVVVTVRAIVISGDVLVDVLSDEIEEMRGDDVVRERVDRVLARDCARRKLCSAILPACDDAAREQLAESVRSWPDETIRQAGEEVLDAAWT
jgi:hypothetical protein